MKKSHLKRSTTLKITKDTIRLLTREDLSQHHVQGGGGVASPNPCSAGSGMIACGSN